MKEVYLTQEGLEELKKRLDYLIVEKRKEVAASLQHARELGDLSENAEYDAAKEEQSHVEAEIKDLEEKIRYAVIIEEGGSHKVSIGSTVTVEFLGDVAPDEDAKMTVRIVGTTEADFASNKISNESPLGRALLGRKEKETVIVSTPNGGQVRYRINAIK